jgi:hypothetical protein
MVVSPGLPLVTPPELDERFFGIGDADKHLRARVVLVEVFDRRGAVALKRVARRDSVA